MVERNLYKLNHSKFLNLLVSSKAYWICKHFTNSILYQLIYRVSIAYSYILNILTWKNKLPDSNLMSIVSIAKNEGNYIREWVAYHKILGINHIYIYDNGSTDNTIDCIKDYIDSNYVTVINFPGQKMQLKAYNDALRKFGGVDSRYRYMAFIDCDEFLVCENNSSIIDLLDSLVVRTSNAGGIALNWKMFGSSGHMTMPTGLVIESFLYRANAGGKGTECVKTVVIPSRVKKFSHPHYPNYKFGYYGISTNGDIVPEWSNVISDYSKIWINHYFTKSLEEWTVRRSLGKADLGEGDKRSIQEFYEHDNNDIYDTGALENIKLEI